GRWDAVEADDPLLAPDGDLAHRLAAANPPGAVSYRPFPARSTSYLALNTRRPPFSNPRLRRAVATAIDRAALAAFWSQTPTDRLLPPAVRGADVPRIAAHNAPPAHTPNIFVRMGLPGRRRASPTVHRHSPRWACATRHRCGAR